MIEPVLAFSPAPGRSIREVTTALSLSAFSSSPFAYVDPLHCNMAYLYLELLKDSLNEYAYAAELAGLSYDLQSTIYGMYVSTHARPSTLNVYIDWMEVFGTVGMTFFKKKKNLYGLSHFLFI